MTVKDRRYDVSEKGRERRLRYEGTEKGLARKRRYNKSPKGRAAKDRYNETVIEVRFPGGSATYHVRPEMKAELQERLAAFRQKQREERSDARIG